MTWIWLIEITAFASVSIACGTWVVAATLLAWSRIMHRMSMLEARREHELRSLKAGLDCEFHLAELMAREQTKALVEVSK